MKVARMISRGLMSFVVAAAIGLAILEPPSSLAAGAGQSYGHTSFWGSGDFLTYSDYFCESYEVTVTSYADVQRLANDGIVSSYQETGWFGRVGGECRTVADTDG